jgi:hypothetical protein
MIELDKLQKLVEDGMSAPRIAAIYKLDSTEVRKIIKENNLSIVFEYFNEGKIDHICDLYKSGVSAKALGKKYSIDKRRVQKWAKERGELRSKADACRFTYFNEHIMDTIDTPTKAYWLGFLYADAYNCDITSTVNVALKGSDEGHLYKLVDFFELDRGKVFREINPEGYDVVNIKLYSKHLSEKLTELGCPRAKSFIIKYPEWLDEKLHSHFIRGMVDGDGSISQTNKEWKFNLASTKECLENIQEIFLKEISISFYLDYISKTNNNTWTISSSGNEKVAKIFTWLYTDSVEENRLDRKFERYQELLFQQASRVFSKGRDNHKISENVKEDIRQSTESVLSLSERHNIHERTVRKIIAENKE